MIGQSPAIRRAISLIEEVGPSDASVIIVGETGTGKELVARAIHEKSRRSRRPFVAINCGGIPDSLIESELFGHDRGAFTGADQKREGYFERANGGTVFLDEITEMRPDLQAKMLRVLEERKFLRLGGSRELPTDVRIIAATNRPLDRAIKERRLREDIYYRLNEFTIELPPLRDRKSDIPLLADYFLKQFAPRYGKKIEGIEQDCLDALKACPWPGNIRQLKNAMHHAVIKCRGAKLSAADLPASSHPIAGPKDCFMVRLGSNLREMERELVVRTLKLVGGNKRRACAMLGISRRALYNRLARYGVHRPKPEQMSLPYRETDDDEP
ncbi:MAG: sigma-54 interaction domain-containing protein [Candidatus Binataceae bacterium]